MKHLQIFSKLNEEINSDKVNRDLGLIKSFQGFAKAQNYRLVVYGGYGLDILLGQITRSHNDVDLVIYGQTRREGASQLIQEFIANHVQNSAINVSENDFMVDLDLKSPGMGANIYYVQVSGDPDKSLNEVVKKSGEHIANSETRFPAPLAGVLGDLHIDVQNPHSHLADILCKQRTLNHRLSHDQDIANLRQITDPARVDEIIRLS